MNRIAQESSRSSGPRPFRKRYSRRELIQDGLLLAAGCAAGPSFLAEAQPAAAGEKKSWTIANDSISRTFAFQPGLGLWTDALTDLETGTHYIEPGRIRKSMAEEFSFQCNGDRCTGSGPEFEYLNAVEESFSRGKSLTIRLRHRNMALEIAVVYRVYDGHAAIRKHLHFSNTGAAALRLSHLAMEAIGISIGAEDEVTLLTQYGTIPREIFYTGRSEDAGLLIANGRTGVGMAVLNEAPGWMKRTEIGGWDDADHVRIAAMYDTDLMPFERSLGRAKAFKRPRSRWFAIATATDFAIRTGACLPTRPRCWSGGSMHKARPGSTTPGSRSREASTAISRSSSSMPPGRWAWTSSPSTTAGSRNTARMPST